MDRPTQVRWGSTHISERLTLQDTPLFDLRPFSPVSEDVRVQACAQRLDGCLQLQWAIRDPQERVELPQYQGKSRRGQLWQHTCCEAFVRSQNQASYLEVNAAFGGVWNLYSFTDYRKGMLEVPDTYPQIREHTTSQEKILGFELPDVNSSCRVEVGLSAVLVITGRLTYWALDHRGINPDFHDPHGFMVSLEPTNRGAPEN